MALSMVDIALWDLAAQRANLPLWRLLGAHHSRLTTYNTDGGWLNRSQEELEKDLKSLVAQGWNSVKIKVGKPDWREDASRLIAAREAVGPNVELMCDANKMWSFQTAQRLLPVLNEVEAGWIEEPFHPDDVDAHRRLQKMTDIPIAVGESLYSRFDFQRFANADAMRVAQIDVTRVGGVTEYLEIASAMGSLGIRVVPHAGDMMVVHQHLVASSFSESSLIEYLPWTLKAFTNPVTMDGNEIILPETAGASTQISPTALKWAVNGIGGVEE
jgi:L-alanine-DL-glutamate epimerase-like enolase superfamily enzyme